MHFNPLSRPVRRFLMEHLEQLHDSLELLGRRLRGSIAQLVGTQVGDAVRDVIESVLSRKPISLAQERWRPEERRWRDPHGYEDRHDESRFWQSDEPEPEQETFAPEPMPQQSPSRWNALLTGAVQVALWWLQHAPHRLSLWKVVSIGGAVGAATLVGGPVVGSVVMIVATTILLTRLTDEMTHATGRMAGVTTP